VDHPARRAAIRNNRRTAHAMADAAASARPETASGLRSRGSELVQVILTRKRSPRRAADSPDGVGAE
jgi:hypothetical protein